MKILKKLLIIFIAIIVAAVFSIQFIVNMPFVKDKVKQAIEKSINRTVSIGNLRVKLLTGCSLNLNDFYIYEKDGKTVFAGLKSLDIGLKLLPLLSKKIDITGISINKPEVTVIKYKNNKYNFSDIVQPSQDSGTSQTDISTPAKQAEKAVQPPKEPVKPPVVLIGYIIISDASLKIKQESQYGNFEDFSFTGLNIKINNFSLDKPIDISLTSNISSSGSVKCDISASSINNILNSPDSTDFDIKLNIEKINSNELDGIIPAETLNSINFSGLNSITSIKGSIQKGLNIDSEMTTSPAKDKQYLALDKAHLKCFVEKVNMQDKNQSKYLETIKITGSLDADSLTYQNNTLSEIHTAILSDKGNVSLNEISAIYCQGTIKGSVALTPVLSPIPFKTDMNISGIQLKDVLAVNTGYDKLTGTANATISIEGKGFDRVSINNNLSGKADLSIKNAVYAGKNIKEDILNAMQNPILAQVFPGLQEQQSLLSSAKTKETKIENLDVKTTLGNGICNVNTLSGKTDSADLSGNGTINFDQTTNLKVQLILSKELTQVLLGAGKGVEKQLPNYLPQENGCLMLPAIITGLISDPKITPDFNIIISSLAKGTIQSSITDALGGNKQGTQLNPLGNILGGQSTGGSGSVDKSKGTTQNPITDIFGGDKKATQSNPFGNILGGQSTSESGSGDKSKGIMNLFK